MSTYSILLKFLAAAFGTELSPRSTPSALDCLRELREWRVLFKNQLLRRDANIGHMIARSLNCPDFSKGEVGEVEAKTKDIRSHDAVCALISVVLASSPPSLLAELREWQQTVHIIACIDTTISYISKTINEGADPQSGRICESMIATIHTFPLPLQDLRPAKSLADDYERVMDRRVFYDEPQMQALIRSLDEPSRRFLSATADRERARLPLFPAHFRNCLAAGGDRFESNYQYEAEKATFS